MRGEHQREGAGCDDRTTSALTGHLGERRSSAGCGGRRCCSNVLRKFATFVWDHPTQLQLRVFIYTKLQQANPTYMKNAPTSAASSIYLRQRTRAKSHIHTCFLFGTRKKSGIAHHGRSSIDQCVFQDYLEILQLKQIGRCNSEELQFFNKLPTDITVLIFRA